MKATLIGTSGELEYWQLGAEVYTRRSYGAWSLIQTSRLPSLSTLSSAQPLEAASQCG